MAPKPGTTTSTTADTQADRPSTRGGRTCIKRGPTYTRPDQEGFKAGRERTRVEQVDPTTDTVVSILLSLYQVPRYLFTHLCNHLALLDSSSQISLGRRQSLYKIGLRDSKCEGYFLLVSLF